MEDRSVIMITEHDASSMINRIMIHDTFNLILNLFQDREISTYLDPNVSVTPMAESHRSMGDTVYF